MLVCLGEQSSFVLIILKYLFLKATYIIMMCVLRRTNVLDVLTGEYSLGVIDFYVMSNQTINATNEI